MLADLCESSDETVSVYSFDVTLATTRISSLFSRRLESSRLMITVVGCFEVSSYMFSRSSSSLMSF